jgi:Uma2 family endonuclease
MGRPMEEVSREAAMPIELTRRRFTVSDYSRMADAGIISADDRVELIAGEIVDMPPIGGYHSDCVTRLTRLLLFGVGERADVSVQNPVRLGPPSQPQPDVALVGRRAYAPGVPGAEDVLLLVEVSDSTAEIDRMVKVPLYAQSGVPEVWLVDLPRETIEAYRELARGGYRAVRAYGRTNRISPAAFPDLVLSAADILS